jgi:hypothetical protein
MGLGPGSCRLRLDGSDQPGGGRIRYNNDHLECDGNDRLGYKGSNQLASESDDQKGGDGLNRAGDGTKDGGRFRD